MNRLVILVIALVLVAVATQAGPLVPAQIAADAKWVAHVDLAGILARPLVQECAKKHESKRCAKFDKVMSSLGIDPLRDPQSLTVYATQYGVNGGVFVVRLEKIDQGKMLAFFRERYPEHKTEQYGDKTLYCWTQNCHRKTLEMAGTFADSTHIVFGTGIDRVKAALDVIAGKTPALTDSAPILKGLDAGSLFWCRAIDVPGEIRLQTLCPVLRQCETATARWTEKDGRVYGLYDFETTSSETARLFCQATDGMKALTCLRFGQLEGLNTLLAGLKYQATDKVFTLSFEAAISDIRALADELKKQRRKQREAK